MSCLCTGRVASSSAGRQGGVQKEAHPVPHPEPAQFLAERNQVVIVDPDQVVGLQQAGLAGARTPLLTRR